MEKRCCICDKESAGLLRLSDGYICAACAMKGVHYGMVRRRQPGTDGKYIQLSLKNAWMTHTMQETRLFFNLMKHLEIVRKMLQPSSISPDGRILVIEDAGYFCLDAGELFGVPAYSICYQIDAVNAFHLDRFYEIDKRTREKRNFYLCLVIELKDKYVPYLCYRLWVTPLMYPQPYEQMARMEGEQVLQFLEKLTGMEASEETETWMEV